MQKYKRRENVSKVRAVFASILSFITSFVLCVACATLLFIVFCSYGNMKPMYVVSESMAPTFSTGDLILTSRSYNGIQEGDVVAYKADWLDGLLVTHRVVEVNGDQLTAKGDNNSAEDPVFDKSKVYGEVVAVLPHVGYLFNPLFFLSAIISSVLMMVATDALRPGDPRNAFNIFKPKSSSKPHWSELDVEEVWGG
jgi:signal peptidase I